MERIFISYRRDDSQWPADRIYEAITQYVQNPNLEVFIDVDGIPLGMDFHEHLDAKVAQCDVLLALIGNDWLEARDTETKTRRLNDPNDFVRIEIASALKRSIPVVPVLLDGARVPRIDELPDDLKPLSRRNGVEIKRLSFKADIERLVKGLGLDKAIRTDQMSVRNVKEESAIDASPSKQETINQDSNQTSVKRPGANNRRWIIGTCLMFVSLATLSLIVAKTGMLEEITKSTPPRLTRANEEISQTESDQLDLVSEKQSSSKAEEINGTKSVNAANTSVKPNAGIDNKQLQVDVSIPQTKSVLNTREDSSKIELPVVPIVEITSVAQKTSSSIQAELPQRPSKSNDIESISKSDDASVKQSIDFAETTHLLSEDIENSKKANDIVERFKERQHEKNTERKPELNLNLTLPNFVPFKGGDFLLGAPDTGKYIGNDEQEKPSFVSDFKISTHEITVRLFAKFVSSTKYVTDAEREYGCYLWNTNTLAWNHSTSASWRVPGFSQTENHPVVCVSWNDADRFARWLSESTNRTFRLPSEIEWEYAAKQGSRKTEASKNCLDSSVANFDGTKKMKGCRKSNRLLSAVPTGSYTPNKSGLYDMLGNVWEWTCSNYTAQISQRESACTKGNSNHIFVQRGGGWGDPAWILRVTNRAKEERFIASNMTGFRLAEKTTTN